MKFIHFFTLTVLALIMSLSFNSLSFAKSTKTHDEVGMVLSSLENTSKADIKAEMKAQKFGSKKAKRVIKKMWKNLKLTKTLLSPRYNEKKADARMQDILADVDTDAAVAQLAQQDVMDLAKTYAKNTHLLENFIKHAPTLSLAKRAALLELRSIQNGVLASDKLSKTERNEFQKGTHKLFETKIIEVQNAKTKKEVASVLESFHKDFLIIIAGVVVAGGAVVVGGGTALVVGAGLVAVVGAVAVAVVLAVVLAIVFAIIVAIVAILAITVVSVILAVAFVAFDVIATMTVNVIVIGGPLAIIAFVVCLILTLTGVLPMSTWAFLGV